MPLSQPEFFYTISSPPLFNEEKVPTVVKINLIINVIGNNKEQKKITLEETRF
jgi:hypothetical protein